MKTAVVTGANTGLGFEITVGLAAAGYTVIMACRDMAKAEAARTRARQRVPDAALECLRLDLVDRDSIRAFADDLKERGTKVDLLVNNAGVFCPPYTITTNGSELMFDANHLGPFLLTALLMPCLDHGDEARIINVSSIAASSPRADIHFDNLNFEGTYDTGPAFWGNAGMTAYCQSKLANVFFTLELAARLGDAGKAIKAIAAHPGVSNTQITRHMPGPVRVALNLASPILPISTPKAGARSILYAALEEDVAAGEFIGPSGYKEYAGRPGRVPFPPIAADKGVQEQLWAISEELTGARWSV